MQQTKTALELEKRAQVEKHSRDMQNLVDTHNAEMLRNNEERSKEIRKYQDSYYAEKTRHAQSMEKVRVDFAAVKGSYETALAEVDRLTVGTPAG